MQEMDYITQSYLETVDFLPIVVGIGLLIGVDSPRALEPQAIINILGRGPYAIKTGLEWVINGPLGSGGSENIDNFSV